MANLTPKEQKIFHFIKTYTHQKGYAPTFSEIQQKFKYRSISSVQQFVNQLIHKGLLKSTQRNLARNIEIIEDCGTSGPSFQIPLEGYVAAGKFTEAVNDREYVDIPPGLIKPSGKYFALRIKGDSMINDGIFDGDLAIIRKQSTANNGQTVVAMVDEDATIKRYYKRANHIELHPANPHFDVMHVYPNENFKIMGVLSSLIRQLEH